jgi:DNA-binding transcriptional LysR family regulator
VPDSPANLVQLSCITTSCDTIGGPGDFTIWRLRKGVELKEIKANARVSVPDPTINHQLALAGAGVALLAQSVVRADVEQGRLIRVLPDWEPKPVELHALYPSRLNSSPKVRAFLQFLRERFGGEPLLDGQED